MSSEPLSIDELPRQNASQVKNHWGEVVRMVRQTGSVAVTNRSDVQMVLVDASTYQKMSETIHTLQQREQARLQSTLDALSERFDHRLTVLNLPDSRARLRALLDSNGTGFDRPIAGATY